MKTDRAQRLVGRIGDQYVSMASDAVEAFAQEEARRKSGRAKLRLIAAAAAAMYIIITVAIILSTLPPSEQPVTPPVDDPGAQDPDGFFQDGPEVQLPESGTFVRYLKNYWLPTWTTVDDPDSLAQSTSPYTVYNFQPDGRVHIIDVNGTSSTGKIGKYSFSDNTIEIWTKGQDGWKKSDLTITLQINETYYNTTMTVTEGEKSTVYIRPECTDEHVEFWNVDDERPVESTDNYYIESIMLSGMSSPISFEVPGLECFKQLNVFHFSAPPALQTAHINSVSYKIYNEAFKLVAEGSSRMDAHSLSSCQLEFPDEPGLYYIDVATSSHEASDIFQQLITHFYAAIQIGEEKVDEPVTPPTLQADPPPTLERLSEDECRKHLLGIWSSGELGEDDTYPIWYVFSPDGYFNIYDAEKNEGQTGVYSFDGSNIGLWLPDENGKWYQTDTQMTLVIHSITQKELHVKDNSGTTRIYQSTTYDHYPILYLGTFDAPMSSTLLQRQTFYQMYLGEIHTNQGASATLDLPPLNVLEGIQPINITDLTPLTEFYISISAEDYSASFIVYVPMGNDTYRIRNTGEINLQKGDYRSYSLADIFDISRASAPGIYYVDIRFECSAPGDVGTFVWHYYVALQNGEEKVDEPVTPEPDITLPSELTDVTSIRLKNLMTNEEKTLEADQIELLLSKWKQVEWFDGGTKTAFEYCFIVNEDIIIYYDPLYCLFEDRENKVFYGMSFEYGNTEEMEWEAAKFASNFLPEFYPPDAFE